MEMQYCRFFELPIEEHISFLQIFGRTRGTQSPCRSWSDCLETIGNAYFDFMSSRIASDAAATAASNARSFGGIAIRGITVMEDCPFVPLVIFTSWISSKYSAECEPRRDSAAAYP